jgi:hypothetical protein
MVSFLFVCFVFGCFVGLGSALEGRGEFEMLAKRPALEGEQTSLVGQCTLARLMEEVRAQKSVQEK